MLVDDGLSSCHENIAHKEVVLGLHAPTTLLSDLRFQDSPSKSTLNFRGACTLSFGALAVPLLVAVAAVGFTAPPPLSTAEMATSVSTVLVAASTVRMYPVFDMLHWYPDSAVHLG